MPAKLSARARVFATGQGRKTDPVDARSAIATAGAQLTRRLSSSDTPATEPAVPYGGRVRRLRPTAGSEV